MSIRKINWGLITRDAGRLQLQAEALGPRMNGHRCVVRPRLVIAFSLYIIEVGDLISFWGISLKCAKRCEMDGPRYELFRVDSAHRDWIRAKLELSHSEHTPHFKLAFERRTLGWHSPRSEMLLLFYFLTTPAFHQVISLWNSQDWHTFDSQSQESETFCTRELFDQRLDRLTLSHDVALKTCGRLFRPKLSKLEFVSTAISDWLQGEPAPEIKGPLLSGKRAHLLPDAKCGCFLKIDNSDFILLEENEC